MLDERKPTRSRRRLIPIDQKRRLAARLRADFRPEAADNQFESSRRTISAPALSALSLPRATLRDSGAMPQLVHG